MKQWTKLFWLSLILTVGLITSACPERTSIADIEANPSKYSNKSVAIAGTVRNSYGVNVPFTQIRGGAYEIDDGSGSMWIVTQNTVPNKGAQIGVKGKIQNGISYGGRNYGLGMLEEDRRFKGK